MPKDMPKDMPMDEAKVVDAATPANELRRILKEYPMREDLARAIARHPNCPKNLYTHFLCYLSEEIKKNPGFGLWAMEKPSYVRPQNLHWEELEKIFRRGEGAGYVFAHHLRDQDVGARICAAKYAPVELLEVLFADTEKQVRSRFAKRNDLPAEWYVRLAADPDASVRREVAKNPNAPNNIRSTLSTDTDGSVRAQLVGATEVDAPRNPLTDPSASVRKALARQSIDAAELVLLASDKVADVRAEAGQNPHLPLAELRRLATDSRAEVRRGVARNAAITPELAQSLMNDAEEVILALAKNQNLAVDLQRVLFAKGDAKVRAAIGEHTESEDIVFAALGTYLDVNDRRESIPVFSALAGNPHFLDRTDLTDKLFHHPNRAGQNAVVQRASHLSLERAMHLLREGEYTIMSSALPEQLLQLLEELKKSGDHHSASWVTFHKVVSKPAPENLELRQTILQKLADDYPQTPLRAKARKLLSQ